MLKTVGFPSTRTGDQTIVAGNLVIGTAGRGIDFSANPNPGGMTSELLNDYEEGDWTPLITFGVGSATYTSTGRYTKVGRQVSLTMRIDVTNWGTSVGKPTVSGLPFTCGAVGTAIAGWEQNATGNSVVGFIDSFSSTFYFVYYNNGSVNAGLANQRIFYIMTTYFV